MDRPSWLGTFATLHEQAACLSVDLSRPGEALDWTERGRALQLRKHFALLEDSRAGGARVVAAHPWLAERGAGVAYLCATGNRTLVLGLTPDSDTPIAEFVDIHERELVELLPPTTFSKDWTERVFAAARALQDRLAPPLMRLAERCRTLYLVPDSRLCFLPFAALETPRDGVLLEKCALALAPSLDVLRRCHGRASRAAPASCLAVGCGSAHVARPEGASDFQVQASAVAALKWPSVDVLLGPDATVERVLGAMPGHDVVHVAAHGLVGPGGQLSSSTVTLANEKKVSALGLAGLDGRMQGSVVFLNSCLGGRFEALLPGEIGGFWEGFLRAGASALVAPLTFVKPDCASELALSFHAQRLSNGVGKAEALRQAQLSLRKKCKDPEDWAAHVLVGDGE